MSRDLTVDNRDHAEMIQYLEARVEVLMKRVRELEAENARVKEDLRKYSARYVFVSQ